MKTIPQKYNLAVITCTALLAGTGIFAQEKEKQATELRITIDEAVSYAKENNNIAAFARKEAQAAEADRKTVLSNALPNIEFSAGYDRYSNLTLYTSGLNDHTTNPRLPTSNAAAAGINATFNLYSGGKQHSAENEAKIKKGLADLNAQDQAGSIGFQTANVYLDLLQLNERKNFIADQLKRAETRLKNINALFQNQKVTRSDVLRAEVMLSNVKLSMEQVQNDLLIKNKALNVLMNIEENASVIPTDSAGMPKPDLSQYSGQNNLSQGSYSLQRADLLIQGQQARLKTIKSNNYPTLALRTGYNLSYPNYLFFPPVDQFYSIGFVGARLQYDIASLYKNKPNSQAAKLRIEEFQIQQQAVKQNVSQEISSLYIKYNEALHRIDVNKTSIDQAKVNYKIVSTKYFNQLALLTDLLDADNLFEETRYNLTQAEVEAFRIYYRLQYLTGKL